MKKVNTNRVKAIAAYNLLKSQLNKAIATHKLLEEKDPLNIKMPLQRDQIEKSIIELDDKMTQLQHLINEVL